MELGARPRRVPSSHRILSSLDAEKDQHMGIPKFDTDVILIDPQDDGVA
jgi:hypothetical protein